MTDYQINLDGKIAYKQMVDWEVYEDGEGNYRIIIEGEEFVFDKDGVKFFLNEFVKEGFKVMVVDGYLVRKNIFHLEYYPQFFHRLYKHHKKAFDKTLHVHHRNGIKADNRNRNLIIKPKKEHEDYHEKREEKISEKYLERGERISARYFARGESFKRKGERARKSKAHTTFIQKFKQRNPNSSWKTASYKWAKFKKSKGI